MGHPLVIFQRCRDAGRATRRSVDVRKTPAPPTEGGMKHLPNRCSRMWECGMAGPLIQPEVHFHIDHHRNRGSVFHCRCELPVLHRFYRLVIQP